MPKIIIINVQLDLKKVSILINMFENSYLIAFNTQATGPEATRVNLSLVSEDTTCLLSLRTSIGQVRSWRRLWLGGRQLAGLLFRKEVLAWLRRRPLSSVRRRSQTHNRQLSSPSRQFRVQSLLCCSAPSLQARHNQALGVEVDTHRHHIPSHRGILRVVHLFFYQRLIVLNLCYLHAQFFLSSRSFFLSLLF